MKNTRLGCFSTSGIMAAVLTVLIITGFAFASGGMLFSPGALNARTGAPLGGARSHAEIAGQCSLCHAPFWRPSSMADRCVVCHTDLVAQWQDQSTLHGVLHQNNSNMTCRNCHPDHRGPDAPLTAMDAAHFPHDSVGYSLTAHQRKTDGSPFGCNDCHAQGYTMFDQAICTTCHAQKDATFMQTHTLDFGSDCLVCHDGVDTYGHTFDHTVVPFQLTGKHVQVQCGQCHVNSRSLAELKSTSQDCYSCHAAIDAHGSRFGTNCGSCHSTSGWTPATFDHNLSAFKLDGQHVNVACMSCHINNVFQGTPTDCYSCHQKDDKHNSQFGTGCDSCHSTAGWKPATFDHDLSTFKLTGQHVNVACTSCHINNVFRGTPTNCNSCHGGQDAHGGQFGTSCGSCHSTSAWTPASFDHNLSTFKLTGQHVNVACTSCHINNVFRGTPTNCNSCHGGQDAHGGQFGTNCGSCHSTNGWKPATFDHNLSGFPLTGAHAGLNCTQCHSGGVFSGLSSACVACHAEPSVHAGVFGTDCAQCHTTSNWNASFSHPGGCNGNCANHENATCTDCHTVNYSTYTCTKCHDNNNPGGGD